ncbi:MAG: IPT/TIG domain-containing protein [Phycisphaerae bacterium]|nr:IPT/TIG domain-containing protein [Phycisphaerae bacterium]
MTSPPGFGNRAVRLVTPVGAGPSLNFLYDPPIIPGIVSTSGPCAGNTQITRTGANMLGVDRVTVGAVAGTIISASQTSVVFRAPPGVGLDLPMQPFAVAQSGTNSVNFSYIGGACCVHTVGCGADECVLVTEAECNARGNGTLLGVGVPCSAPCTTTIACCLPTGPCLQVTDADCIALGGTSAGPGSNCASASCAPTRTCPADMNLDEMIDGGDVQDFVNALFSSAPCP